eukprot:1136861-Pelagomonas_calceolata.AAC.10
MLGALDIAVAATCLCCLHAEDLSTHVSCEPVALDTRLLPQGQLRPVRDGACCACGPSSFVAIGGFDGQKETMDMLVFKVRWPVAALMAQALMALVALVLKVRWPLASWMVKRRPRICWCS